ncbi:hypothetical protein KCU81_g6802, partial [Aureobasidium melanogenum]
MLLNKDELMTCTFSEESNDKPEASSEVAIAQRYPAVSNSQPIETQSKSGGDSPPWSRPSNHDSSLQRELYDPQQASAAASTISTPDKPATLDNAKVLLRKADKLLFGKLSRSHDQSEEDPEALLSPSNPWSSPSSNESENDLKKARGYLRAAHKMLELVGFKRNDGVWGGSDHGEDGSLGGSTELGGDETMDLDANMGGVESHVSVLQGRIRELEAQLRDALAALDSERGLVRELREELRLQDLDVASLPVPRSNVLRPRAIGSRNASDYWDKLPKFSPKKKTVRFNDSGTGTKRATSHNGSPGAFHRALHSMSSSDLIASQQKTADTQAQSGCMNNVKKQSKDQIDRDERMITALREHSASLDKHTAALERYTAAIKEQTRGSDHV